MESEGRFPWPIRKRGEARGMEGIALGDVWGLKDSVDRLSVQEISW